MFQEARWTPIDLPTCTFAACHQAEVVQAARMTPPAGVFRLVDNIFRFNSCGIKRVKNAAGRKIARHGHGPSSQDRRQIEDAELSDAYKVGLAKCRPGQACRCEDVLSLGFVFLDKHKS